jgi:hypothetical protein
MMDIYIHHIGRSHPIGEAKDGKISIIVRFLTYRQRHMVFSNNRKLKGNKDKMFIAENLTIYRYDLLRQLNGMKKINKVHTVRSLLQIFKIIPSVSTGWIMLPF